MTANHADRNLLLGILALQMDFINRDALVAAMNAWVLQKSKSLSTLLLELGKIKADEQKLLEGLVDKHLERHGNDPASSLAALASASDLRAELSSIGDADVEASLRSLPAETAHDDYGTQVPSGIGLGSALPDDRTEMMPARSGSGSGSGRSGAPSAPSASLKDMANQTYTGSMTAAGLRFQIIRPHAKGGLGQVSVAEDTELHREVALKEIQPAYARDHHSRSRFLLEAEITGGLEHPGIVPVYGLGHYEDGRPFYAMRFIRGDSLKEAVDRFFKEAPGRSPGDTALELRNLVGRLIDVCNAMEYAHSRGVLHRDLKPGNIMLGKYGETLVVDWGLAKPLDRPEPTVEVHEEGSLKPISMGASAPTMFGTAVGTPQYMSPEQAAGRMELLGPASDVYSLGATLYSILTGKSPFDDRDLGTVLMRVQRGDFKKPRELNPQVPKPLDAICCKAMALEPKDRYSSPVHMANDLECWLADEPNTAYQETFSERAMRWIRRNRTWATAAAAAVMVVAAVSLIAAFLINEARVKEKIARREAETSFQLARKAVDDFFTRVSEDTLLNVPGLQPLRKDLLQVALSYDHEFLKQRGNDPSLKAEAAAARFRIGTVTGEIGSKREALDQFEQARQIQQAIVDANSTPEARFAVANTINSIGGIEQATGKLADARKHFDEARQLRAKLVEESPDNDEFQRKLANSLNNLGAVERAESHPEKAVTWYSQANGVRVKLVERNPKQQFFRRDLARGYYNVGTVEREADKLDDAATSFLKAIDVYDKLVEDFPLVIEYRRELGLCHKTLGDLRSHTDRFQDAQECYERARVIQEPLAHENPLLVELAADLAGTFMGLGDLKNLLGESAAATRLHTDAGAILRTLVRDNPAVTRFRQDLAAYDLHFGMLQFAAGENAKARASYQAALEAYTNLLKEGADNRALQDGLARAQTSLAIVARNEGALDEAFIQFDQARQTYAALAAKLPNDAPLADLLAASHSNLAAVEQARGNTEAALDLYGKAQEIHQRWLEGPAATLEHRQHLAETLYMVGALRIASEQWTDAVAALQRSAELAGGLLINHAKNAGFRTLRASSLHDQGYALWQLDRKDESVESYRQACAEQRTAFELNPKDEQALDTLNRYLTDQASVERDTGRYDEALAVCLERQKLWPGNSEELYNVARDVAIIATTVGEGQPDLSAEMKAKRDQLSDQAIAILTEAVRAGFKNWQQADTDPDLDIVRTRPGYKTLTKKE